MSSELRNATGCRRGEIAGRWTKPVAAFPVGSVPSKAESLSRTQLRELYPGSTDATSLKLKLVRASLLTAEANDVVSPVHDRMPIILERKDYGGWLDPQRRRLEDVSAFLQPFPAERMVACPVGRWVNDQRHDDPRCVEPAT